MLRICLAILALLSLPAWSLAAEADSDGFVPIFNGKDLSGWVYGRLGDGETKEGKGYQVEYGLLVCTPDDGGNLFTEKEYTDFALRFEFRLSPNANNGVGIRTPTDANPAYAGMEIQVLDDSGTMYGNLRPAQYHGSIYDVVPAKRGHLNPVGEWNEEEITARGRQITVKLNGATIVDANLDEIKDEDVLKNHPGLANKKGHIGFLGHGARIEFRNIRVKEL